MFQNSQINAVAGDTAIFVSGAGYPAQQQAAEAVLTIGKSYIIEKVEIGGWETMFTLSGQSGRFNSVMFAPGLEPEVAPAPGPG